LVTVDQQVVAFPLAGGATVAIERLRSASFPRNCLSGTTSFVEERPEPASGTRAQL
jgi:hypothetical protein